MAIAQVQKQRAQGTGTTLTATFDSAPTAGNLLIATAGTSDSVSPVNPPSGWSTATENDTGLVPRGGIYYKVAGASEPTGVTITFGASADGRVHIFEYSGGTWTLDVASNLRVTNASSVTTPTLATAQAEELLIASVETVNVQEFLNTWTNSFTRQQVDASSTKLTTAHLVTSSSGSYNTNESWTGGGVTCRACIAAFIVTGGGPVEKSASDTLTLGVTDTPALAGDATASDTLGLAVNESASLAATLDASDTLSLQLTEDASLFAFVTKTASDTLGISIQEATGIAAQLAAEDTLSLSVSEALSLAAELNATDELSLTLEEQLVLGASLQVADTLGITLDEAIELTWNLTASDTLTVGITETATTQDVAQRNLTWTAGTTRLKWAFASLQRKWEAREPSTKWKTGEPKE